MDADNEKLIQELMQNWLVDYLPDNGVLMNAKLMLREAISRTQEATRREILLELADKIQLYVNPAVPVRDIPAMLRRMAAEAPTKPPPEVKP